MTGMEKQSKTGRRNVLRAGAALVLGGALAGRLGLDRAAKGAAYQSPVIFLEACTACTGCAAVCPTGAIIPGPVMTLDEERCVRCGYCAAVCPVSGAAMGRE